MSARRDISPRLVIAVLALGLLVTLVAATALGAVAVAPGDVIASIGRALRGESGGMADTLIVQVRLPRVLLAALVGACLAGAGAIYQALFRNPLADPYILGISSGAGLAAILALTFTAGATVLRYGVVPVAAFIGALLTMLLVTRLATWRGQLDTASLLLAGVAVSYTLAAMTSFVMVFAREQMAAVVFWMMGGLGAASWPYVAMIAPMAAIGAVLALSFTRELNLMLLGDERAGQLGLPVRRFKYAALTVASLLTAAAVAVAGLIGFVGLMVPHMVRLTLGPDHKWLVPASLLGGAITLVLADLVARTIIAPIEIPVGVVTALLGGPFFVWLLLHGGRSL
ncbi:MAG TPA: iron ABC transporter permease [Coriobacteriia bacterium]|nr:iron ABC transporter permease [Coriobacteriia bacterium]